MGDAIWYVTLDGGEQGPLAPTQVKQLVAAGRIVATTPIRREGMPAPVPAAQVKGLLPPMPTPALVPVQAPPATRPATPATEPSLPAVRAEDAPTRPPLRKRSGTGRSTVTTRRTAGRPVRARADQVENPYAAPDAPLAADDAEAQDAPVPAGFGIRVAAYVIDAFLLLLLFAVGLFLAVVVALRNPDLIPILSLLLGPTVLFGYYFVCEGTWRATLGKRLLGLRVVGGRGYAMALKRTALRLLFWVIPFGGLVDVLMALRPNRLTLHDQFSGTAVVRGGAPRRRTERPAGRSGTGRVTTRRTRRAA